MHKDTNGHRPMFDQDAAASGQRPRRASQPAHTPAGGRPRRATAPAPTQQGRPAQRSAPRGATPAKRRTSARTNTYTGNTRAGAPKRRRRKKSHRLRNTLVALFLILAVVGVGVFAFTNNILGIISGEDEGMGVTPPEVNTLPEYTGKGIVNFLVCGLDYDEDENGVVSLIGRTDMILYVHYDTAANKASILQIPRDVYVGDKARTGGTYKINNLYFYAEDTDNRMAALQQVLYDQFKLPCDFYVTIEMDGVKEIIDIVSLTKPFEVYVPMDINNPETGDVMRAGWRSFTGEEAEYFLRNRKSDSYGNKGDVMRLQMQQYFYSALYREFTGLSGNDLVMWMKVLLYRIKTDQTDLIQLGGLAQKALNLQSTDITFIRPSVGGASKNGQSLLTLIPEDFAALLNEYFRPDGESYTAAQLNIYTLPVIETMGIHEESIRTMGDIQASEG